MAAPVVGPIAPVVPPPPPTFSVKDAMVLCGVQDAARAGVAGTDAERIASNLFNNDFNSCMDYDTEELKDDLKSFTDLRANQGRIVLLPIVKKRIRAFIQWTRDQLRMGMNPINFPFPVGETQQLLKKMTTHEQWVERSKTAKEPKDFTNDMKWDDWIVTFIDYLSQLPGRNGVPLKYVVRDNDLPDPTPNADFLQEYVNMAPLQGDGYIEDAKSVLTLLNKYIVGNEMAEATVSKPLGADKDGRDAVQALRDNYEGKGMAATKLLEADKTIKTLFYKDENPFKPWKKFEAELVNAYAVLEKHNEVHTDGQKLQQLQNDRIRADFLVSEK